VRVTRTKAVQVHPVPSRITSPKGPFPPELFRESKIVTEYDFASPEDGSDFPVGATVQNDFQEVKWMICASCYERMPEAKTGDHVCEEE